MWGARAGGLRETNCINFESEFQFLHPDTIAGRNEENEVTSKSIDKYFKLPPNKRTNYSKFSITSPFQWSWSLLIKEWSISQNIIQEFCVLRDRNLLKKIQVIV